MFFVPWAISACNYIRLVKVNAANFPRSVGRVPQDQTEHHCFLHKGSAAEFLAQPWLSTHPLCAKEPWNDQSVESYYQNKLFFKEKLGLQMDVVKTLANPPRQENWGI